MISGVHGVVFAHDAERARAFLADVFDWPSVDAGGGWMLFALPPSELAVHPTDRDEHDKLYLMCDDIEGTVAELKSKGVDFASPISDEGWGLLTALKIPGRGELGLYEPKHPTALQDGR
jgi:hypothetical protein